jgi:hypothetical protein
MDMGKPKLKALADRGYYSGIELKACDDAGIRWTPAWHGQVKVALRASFLCAFK